MPNCLCCKTNHRVSPRGFQRHFRRLIINQQDNYYIIGRSYYCKKCQEDNEQSKISFERQAAKLKAQAEELGIEAEITVKRSKIPYTFMGWDRRILPLFADGVGDEFPAFLTKRAGVDLSIIDWMMPLFDKGVKAKALEEMLLEFHSKQFFKRHIRYEHDMSAKRRLNPNFNYPMFGEFGDKELFNGKSPTGRVSQLFHPLVVFQR